MIYADYSYYTESFGGSLIPSAEWNHAAGMASDWMDAETFGRLCEGVPAAFETQVKRCCCELAEQLYQAYGNPEDSDGGDNRAVASEKIGSYSVTYRSSSELFSAMLHGQAAGLEDVLHGIVRKHLGRTGLLYRGVED